MAEPSCTTTACIYDNPQATPAITSYPTTLTLSSTWSTVRTVTPDDDPAGPLQTTTEYQRCVTYEPHDASPTSFPATVLQSVTTSHTFVWTSGGKATTTTTDEPTSSQWIVHQPAATDLPRRALGGPPNATAPAGWIAAPQCVDAGQDTGCVRQCTQRDGLWYCFDKHAWYEENVMGRVCWWTQPDDSGTGAMVLQYLMLAEPCRVGDRHVQCDALVLVMADRFSSAVQAALAAVEGSEGKPATSQATLRLTFAQPDGKPAVVVGAGNAGTAVTPIEAKDEPALALHKSVTTNVAPGQKFFAASLDPDAPFPSWPFLGPILHGVQTDLILGDADGDWTTLTSSVKPVINYIKPGPPSPSSAHRYVFFVWKQPDGLNAAGVSSKMGWAPEGVSRMGRMRFDANTLEQNLGLGDIVAVNFFRSQQRQ
ncbi:hypothetical protein SEUCBS139899_002466 [Sporothrix eucalyptigena]|uniref:Phosphatidylethanolamine-binding protein n=1 Tax=Sporothrix eucalyptigena TaxID=1812306 RepID=A0ABP0B468_9PEZI